MAIDFFDHGFGDLARGRTIGPCRWDRFDLLCIHRGLLRLELEAGEPLSLGARTGVLIFPGTFFRGEVLRAPCRISVQHFGFRGFAATDVPLWCRPLWGRKNGVQVLHWPPELGHDLRRAIALAFGRQTPQVQALREAQLQLTLAGLVPVDDPTPLPGRGGRMMAMLPAALAELGPAAAVEDLARRFDISERQLRRDFREAFGESPGRYLRRHRLREAARLLRETDLPIKVVAARMGYGDTASFHHAFCRHQRATPATYRDQFTLKG